MNRLKRCAALLVAMLGGSGASAHHSAAVQYDVDKTISLAGVVKEFRFINPHSIVRVAVTDDKGVEVVWSAEWVPTTILRRMGLKPDAVKAGERVTIRGNPARDGAHDLLLQQLTFADGRVLGMAGAGPAASNTQGGKSRTE